MGEVQYPSPPVSQGPAPLHIQYRFLQDVKCNSVLYSWSSLVIYFLYQFSRVAQSCLTLCDPTDCNTPGFPVHHQLPELAQTHFQRVGDAHPTISSPVVPLSSCLQSFPASGSFPMSQFFASGGQSIGASASALVMCIRTAVEPWALKGDRPCALL